MLAGEEPLMRLEETIPTDPVVASEKGTTEPSKAIFT